LSLSFRLFLFFWSLCWLLLLIRLWLNCLFLLLNVTRLFLFFCFLCWLLDFFSFNCFTLFRCSWRFCYFLLFIAIKLCEAFLPIDLKCILNISTKFVLKNFRNLLLYFLLHQLICL